MEVVGARVLDPVKGKDENGLEFLDGVIQREGEGGREKESPAMGSAKREGEDG